MSHAWTPERRKRQMLTLKLKRLAQGKQYPEADSAYPNVLPVLIADLSGHLDDLTFAKISDMRQGGFREGRFDAFEPMVDLRNKLSQLIVMLGGNIE